MAILRLDELNIRSEPFEEYFSVMGVSKAQKRLRISLAEEIMDDVLELLYSLDNSLLYGVAIGVYAKEQFVSRMLSSIASFMTLDSYIVKYVNELADDIIKTTEKNSGEDYFLSEDRARFIAENESNTVANHGEFTTAKERGYKHKTWHSQGDQVVRQTHKSTAGERVKIDDMFHVGDAEMLYPKDFVNASDHPEETVNCRCWVTYSA